MFFLALTPHYPAKLRERKETSKMTPETRKEIVEKACRKAWDSLWKELIRTGAVSFDNKAEQPEPLTTIILGVFQETGRNADGGTGLFTISCNSKDPKQFLLDMAASSSFDKPPE